MNKARYLVLLAAVLALPVMAAVPGEELLYDEWFTADTMRVDLMHTGNFENSVYSLDEVIMEGPWPGSRTKLIDTTNLGFTLFCIYDAETGTLIYSRGFSSVFEEWTTTSEAKETWKSFSESALFPMPKKPFILTLANRNEKNEFVEEFRVTIDPNFRNVRKEKRYSGLKVVDLHVPDTPDKTYDILILPEGYTADEVEKMRKDYQRVADVYLNAKPYSEMKDRVAIRAIEVFSRDSGPDQPRQNIWNDTAFCTSFNSFDSARYVLTYANKDIRDIAANAPYEGLSIMVNTSRYGGGGIYNLYATYAVDNEFWEYLITHECGHTFCGLGDEYYTSDVSYSDFYKPGVEPWEANITAFMDKDNVKWKAMLTEGVPLPTPEEEQYRGMVGVFEGAGYVAKGFFRPALDCLMFSREEKDPCPVCLAAMKKTLEFYIDK